MTTAQYHDALARIREDMSEERARIRETMRGEPRVLRLAALRRVRERQNAREAALFATIEGRA